MPLQDYGVSLGWPTTALRDWIEAYYNEKSSPVTSKTQQPGNKGKRNTNRGCFPIRLGICATPLTSTLASTPQLAQPVKTPHDSITETRLNPSYHLVGEITTANTGYFTTALLLQEGNSCAKNPSPTECRSVDNPTVTASSQRTRKLALTCAPVLTSWAYLLLSSPDECNGWRAYTPAVQATPLTCRISTTLPPKD